MIDRDEMLDQVALYALGVLTPAESDVVRAYIASSPEAQREYAALRTAADAVGLIAEEPVDSARSARMRERLLAQVHADLAPAPLRRSAVAPAWTWASGLAAAVALVFATVTVVQDVALRGQLAQAQRRADDLRGQLAVSQRTSARDRQTLSDLLAPDAQRFTVAQGTVVRHETRIVMALEKLPQLPRGRVYQAWTAAPGSTVMQPSVTFTPNTEGVAVVALPVDARRVGVVAVSVEPEGGSRALTTTPTFIRPLS